MFFSIIIPTCNRDELLGKCLSFLQQQTDIKDYEVIVTDDSLDEKTKHFIELNYSFVIWLAGPKKGPAANRNNGAKHAKGEWLVFLDDDIIPSIELLDIYKNAVDQYPASLVFEGAIYPDNWELLKSDLYECPVNLHGGCFWSANICIKRSLFISIGGFDERFIIAAQEDQDLFLRLQEHSTIIFLPNAHVIHPIRRIKLFKPINIIILIAKNYVFFILKHNIYKNVFHLTLSKCLEFARNLKKRKSFLVFLNEFYGLFIGLPLMLLYYIKYKYFVNN